MNRLLLSSNEVISRAISFSLIGILVVSIISFFICNIVMMLSYPEIFSYVEWIWLIPAIILVWINMRVGKNLIVNNVCHISPNVVGFLFCNMSFITVLLTYDTKPSSDWQFVWNAANEMVNGTFTDGLERGAYMHEIPYQLGFAFVESLVIRLFGSSYWIFKLFNLLLMNFITWSTYHFSLRKASLDVARFAYVSSCMFLCYLMTVGQFTNHQLGFVLLYLSLWLFEKNMFLTCCCAGISAACLNFVRPMGIMIVASVLFYTIYILLNDLNKRKAIWNFIGFYLCYYLFLLLFDLLLLGMNYTDDYVSRSTRNMYHKISYTTYDSKIDGRIADYNYDYDAYNKAYKEELVDMVINHPKEIAVNVTNKMIRYLGMLDYLFEMTYDHDETVWKKYPIKAFYSIQWFQYVIFLTIALYGFIEYRKSNRIDLYQIFFVGNTFVYFFVEAFSSYRFVNYFYILFLVGFGMNELYKKRFRGLGDVFEIIHLKL
jgi:hypothetical protein